MKKAFLVFLGFLTGIVATYLILANPLDFGSFHWVQSRLGIAHEEPDAVSAGQLWTCGMHLAVTRDEPGRCPICQMELTPLIGLPGTAAGDERSILYWRAPMDPSYISDEPGKSPMGMDLVPVYAGDSGGPSGIVQLDVGYLQTIGVRSIAARRGDLPVEIRSVGRVRYDDQRMSLVTTKYEGWVEAVRINLVGERIEKGQRLFEIYSPKLVSAQQEYLQAVRYARELAGSEYPDVKRRAEALISAAAGRLEYWDVAPEQLRELEQTGQALRTLPVLAPSSGVVVEKMGAALEGMFVRPGMNLFKIAGVDPVLVEADVFENQLRVIRPGQPVEIRLPYEAGLKLLGRVRLILPEFASQTRTLKALVEVANPTGSLKAEMYVDVLFQAPGASQVVLIPEESVIHSGLRQLAVLDRGGGLFQVVEVTLGASGQGLVEIVDGIREGDEVVVSSQFLIDSESNLREAIRRVSTR